jgi:hypothetical protein
VVGSVPNVLQLELPSATKLLLDAGGPLHGIGRVVLRRQHDELGLREELRRAWSRDLGLGKRIGSDRADRPRTAKTYRSSRRYLLLADSGSIGWVIFVALAGEEVNLVITQGKTRAYHNPRFGANCHGEFFVNCLVTPGSP